MKKILVLLFLIFCFFMPVTANAVTNSDKVTIAGDVNIDRETSGTVVAVAGNVHIDKDIQGTVVSVFGDVTINAKVSGDVVAVLGKVKLTDNAQIEGNLISIGSIDKSDKAQIYGQNVIISTGNIDIGNDFHMEFSKFMMLIKMITLVSFIVLTLLFGLPLLGIFSKTFKTASIGIEERLGYKLTIGFLGLLGAFIIMILLSWTVIVPILFFFVIIMARVAVSIYFGKVILNIFDAKLNRFMEFFTGFITIVVIKIMLLLLIPSGGVTAFGVEIGWDLVLSVIFDIFILILGFGILISAKISKNKTIEATTK